ncbi:MULTISPECIES: transposase [Limosilactobacillus]|uniref:transposase n=1 Tax=Limosilactobacillus TaxID=2742598 RepID=UPI001CDC7BED|nr:MULTISPECIES: transposase [Limosilactobacillus]MCC4486842.1 transposase [Limosilactobacillus reuteri]
MDNDTRTLLNLTDPHLNFPHHWLKYKSIKNVQVAQISCTLSYIPRACPNCGVINRGQMVFIKLNTNMDNLGLNH